MTIDALFTEALSLSDDQRAELVDRLLGSLPAEIPSALHPTWRNVVQRRSGELDFGTVTPVPWDEVRRSAWELRSV
jgi:putative addiction module component (TIGR02574 family)